MILPPEEIVKLTKRTRPSAQARELHNLGIPYRRRRDGSLVVMNHDAYPAQRASIEREPRLRLVNGSPT